LGGDARSVSAAPASALRPSENEAVLKAFNHEVLVVKSRKETRGWETFVLCRRRICSGRYGRKPAAVRARLPIACLMRISGPASDRVPLKVAARLRFPVYTLQLWHLSDLHAERL
jgi:hypothetical protein